MTRGNFFKSILALAVSPKIVGELGIDKIAAKNIATNFVGVNKSIISDLQLLSPHYYKQYVEKYGNEDYTWWLSDFAEDKKPL